MSVFKAAVAIPKGLQLCLLNKKVRALALWPWIAGVLSYFASLAGVYFLHPIVLEMVVSEPTSIWSATVYYLAWFFIGLGLLAMGIVLSLAFVMIFTAVFQAEIAIEVLKLKGCEIPAEDEGISSTVKEGGRVILVEAGKLLWMLPLMIIIFIIGLIPIFSPFALAANAWLLSYQFIDVVLDLFKTNWRERFKFARQNAVSLIVFGLTLTFLWAIPLLGLLLPPAVIAGAAWYIEGTNGLKEIAKKKL